MRLSPFFDDLFNSTKMHPGSAYLNRINMCKHNFWTYVIPLQPLLLLLFDLVTAAVSHNHVVLFGLLCFVEAVFYI